MPGHDSSPAEPTPAEQGRTSPPGHLPLVQWVPPAEMRARAEQLPDNDWSLQSSQIALLSAA